MGFIDWKNPDTGQPEPLSEKIRIKFRNSYNRTALRQYLAEFIGTGLFIYVATGAVVGISAVNDTRTAAATVLIGLSFGFSIAAMIYATANVSGGHLNPAVTASLVVTGNKNPFRGIGYITAQLCAAMVASGLVRATTPYYAWNPVHLGATSLGPGVNVAMGFFLEFIITFGLAFTIFGTTALGKTWGKLQALAVGLAIMIGHLFGAPFTGPSMNPARSFGPALWSGYWHENWLYWIAPTLGAITAGIIYEVFLKVPPATPTKPSTVPTVPYPSAASLNQP